MRKVCVGTGERVQSHFEIVFSGSNRGGRFRSERECAGLLSISLREMFKVASISAAAVLWPNLLSLLPRRHCCMRSLFGSIM